MVETPPTPGTSARKRPLHDLGLGVVLVLVTLLCYWPALRGGLLVDDSDHITRMQWRSSAGLARIWFDVGITSQYFPLLHTAFWIEYHLWQDAVLGYHLANILQHAMSALLVVAVMRRLALPGAWLAGFIFALHPVCVESVAWIAEQKNTLSTLLYLAAGYVYLGFDRDRRSSRYWLAFGLFILALLTKSVTATLVAVLLVVFWWQRGRLEFRRDFRPLLPWLLAGTAMGLFTTWYERVYASAQGASFELSLLERGLIAGRAIVFYFQTLLCPTNLMFINPRWSADTTAAWQYVFPGIVILIAGALALLARRWRAPLALFLIYVGTLGPILGFLNINWFNYSFVADHFQYLACIGLIVPGASALTIIVRRWLPSFSAVRLALIAAPILFLLGFLTWRQSGNYRDLETLCRRTIAQNPSSWYARHNLGAILLGRPDGLEEAITQLVATLDLKPNHLRAYFDLGRAFSRIPSRLPDATRAFEAALRLKPDDPLILAQLAQTLALRPGRAAEAEAAYRRAMQLDPLAWEVHAGLAQLLASSPGRLAEVISEYQAAIRLNPGVATLYNDLGGNLASAGRTAEAIAAIETALRLRPDYAEAHYNLGSLLADLPGRATDAVSHFEAALRLTPDDPAIHNNLGLVLLRLPGRRSDAIRHFEIVLQRSPASAEGHFNLGRALLSAPPDERAALKQFETAAQLRPDWDAARNVAAQLRARLP